MAMAMDKADRIASMARIERINAEYASAASSAAKALAAELAHFLARRIETSEERTRIAIADDLHGQIGRCIEAARDADCDAEAARGRLAMLRDGEKEGETGGEHAP